MVRVGAGVNRSLERRAAALMQQAGERELAQNRLMMTQCT
jgi:hypothetical protein